ncbi:C4-dicarboxylate TRAP transporter substrate-binding protein [Marimonas sp. MJW-29]|uniref:C4-dicarboxylate TRAP transporter substrate-binding protein n=1 Tax=Sulfitobacter sediminis TaxID=3234186 RepID=A0ABV3RRD5_9RHOB
MKRKFRALLLAGVAALPVSAAAETFNATIAAGHPPVFRWVKMLDEVFVPAVNAKLEGTEHSVNFTGQYGGAIAKVGEELEAVEAGLAELGTCQALFDPAKMAPQNVTYYTPFVSDDVGKVGELMHRLQIENETMQASYENNGVVYVGAPITIDDYLLMTNFPVASLADLEGRKIGAPGAALNWLQGTGAVGVSGNLTTYYNEIKTGVFDGVIVFASAALPGKLFEVAPYITRAGLGAQYAGSICANKDWWESLPAEVQTAMTEAASETGAWYTANLEAAVEGAFKAMGDAGATITDAPQDMREAWAAGMDNAAKEWAAGIPGGADVLSTYMEEMRAAGATPLRDWDKE